MKNIVSIFICLFIFFCSSEAQINLGIRGGVSSSVFKADEVITDDYSIKIPGDATLGFHFGLVSRVQLFSIFIQPELLFTTAKNEMLIEDLINGGAPVVKEQVFNKIDIPVLAGYNFGFFRLEGGPVASIIINSKSELKDITGYEEKFNNATFGYQIGFGIDIFKIILDFKYEGNLSKLGDGVMIGGQERSFDTRASQYIISLGLFF